MDRARQGYQPRYADQQARARRWRGPRLDRDPTLRRQVLTRLQQGGEQVAGRLARDSNPDTASLTPREGLCLASYLPRAKFKRGRRGRKGGSSAIAHRRALAADRQTPGHWEADLMLAGGRPHVGHGRHSRLLLAVRPPGKAAAPIARALSRLLAPLPPPWRQTVTFDNGTEFARHHQLHARGIQTFFCDPHAPWQKGGIENAIGRLRRTRPADRSREPPGRSVQGLQQHATGLGTRPPPRCFGIICCLECESIPASAGMTGQSVLLFSRRPPPEPRVQFQARPCEC